MSGLTLIVEPFTFEDHYLAEIYAEEEYEKAFSEEILTIEETMEFVIKEGWWSQEDDEILTKIPKNIEQMKLDYYNNFHSVTTKKYIKSNIDAQEKMYSEYFGRKMQLYSNTCEYLKNQARLIFLIERSLKNEKGMRVDSSKVNVLSLLNKYNAEILGDEEIRDLAKGSFRSIWAAHKGTHTLFENKTLTDMQISLVNWCKIYDNVHESSDCPTEEVINDNIGLDGWFIHRHKKNEEEKKKNESESKLSGKIANAGEVFIKANSREDIDSIYNMNSFEGKRKIKMLERDLVKHGTVDDRNLSSVKQEVGMAANRAAIEAMKGR